MKNSSSTTLTAINSSNAGNENVRNDGLTPSQERAIETLLTPRSGRRRRARCRCRRKHPPPLAPRGQKLPAQTPRPPRGGSFTRRPATPERRQQGRRKTLRAHRQQKGHRTRTGIPGAHRPRIRLPLQCLQRRPGTNEEPRSGPNRGGQKLSTQPARQEPFVDIETIRGAIKGSIGEMKSTSGKPPGQNASGASKPGA